MNPPIAAPPAFGLGAPLFDAWAGRSREWLALTDAAGRIAWCNAAWAAGLGLGPDADLLDLAPPDWHRGAPRAALAAALRDGRPVEGELPLQSAAGATRWVEVRVASVDDRRLWTLADLGEPRALRAQVDRLERLLEIARSLGGLGVWERALPSGEGRWDAKVHEFFGVDAGRAPLSQAEMLAAIHPDDRNGNYLASLQRPGRHGYRFRVVRPGGEIRRIRSEWDVRDDDAGVPERALGIMVDETAAHELAHSRDAAAAELDLVTRLADLTIWRHDLVTDRIYCNDNGRRLFELPPGVELTLASFRADIHPDDVDELNAGAEQALATGEPVDVRVRRRRAAGGWRDLLVRRVIEYGPAGDRLGFVGIALDVSEQFAQLRRAEDIARRFEAATGGARLGVWASTMDGDALEWNAEMYRLFDAVERPALPTLAAFVEHAVHPEDRERVVREVAGYFGRPGSVGEIEFRTVRRDGRTRWTLIRAHLDPAAESTRMVGIAMDVDERHEAVAALHSAATRVALIARQAGIGTWESRLDGSEAVWDEQMWRLRGLAPQKGALDRGARMALVHPDDRPQVIDAIPSSLDGRETYAYEFRVLLPEGRWRWLASRSTLLTDAEGRPSGRVGVNWDVTDAKSAEFARQQAVLAEREYQAKTAFLARMSHELRTPLNAVLGFAQLLERDARRSRALQRAATLGHIRTAGEHLLTLIDDALDWSRLEAGTVRLELQPVDARTAVEEALPLVAGLAADDGIELEVGPLDGTMHADPTRLRQVLLNLLTNAIKYNRPDGRVTIESALEAGDEVRLRVADTGRGIRPDQLPELFLPFNRLGVEGEGIQGSGIGLTIVKALVQGMGGRIEVRSTVGEGTVFEILLPAATPDDAAFETTTLTPAPVAERPAAAPTDPAASPAASTGRRGRLLYIEDNVVNVLLVEELLKLRPKLAMHTAPDGGRGVAAAREIAPDLVLVDMQLPDFDGFEVLRRLREDPATRDLRCIALSANAMPDDVERARAAGFDDYWTKPIRFKPFLAALDRLFAGIV